ncbi:MAG: hypothetical protein Ta2A_24710 [Treponemataceae bacterium]|nr:MAG: hypothetical protein Ta2A_24710 [Treponemataceae bacterium]
MPRFGELAPLLLPDAGNEGAAAVIFDFDGTLYDLHGFILRLNLTAPWYAFRMLNEHRTRKSLRGSDFGNADAFYDEFFRRFAETLA